MASARVCMIAMLLAGIAAPAAAPAADPPSASTQPVSRPLAATRPATRPSAKLAPILNDLAGGDAATRARAIRELVALGPEAAQAVPFLLTMMADPRTREPATAAFRALGGAAVPGLIEALLGDDPIIGWTAALYLHEPRPLDRAAVQRIAAGLRSGEERVRRAALVILQDDGPAAHDLLPALTAMLTDRQIGTRHAAAELLGTVLARYRVSYLARPAQESDVLVVAYYQSEGEPPPRTILSAAAEYVNQRQAQGDRIAAAARSALAGQAAALDEKIAGLLGRRLRLELDAPGLATNDLDALKARSAALRDQIEKTATKIQRLQSDRDRLASTLGTGRADTQPADQREQLDKLEQELALLKKDLSDSASGLDRYEAAIAHFPELRAQYTSITQELTAARTERDRWAAGLKLLPDPLSTRGIDTGRLGQTMIDRRPEWTTVTEVVPADPRAVAALARALGDADPGVRAAAARALGKIGPEATAALTALDQATRDPDANVREAASEAVRTIKPS